MDNQKQQTATIAVPEKAAKVYGFLLKFNQLNNEFADLQPTATDIKAFVTLSEILKDMFISAIESEL